MASSVTALLPHQPVKSLYIALIALTTVARLPLWLLTSILSSTRLHPSYTFFQNIMINVAKLVGYHGSLVHSHPAWTLASGAEGGRFERIKPSTNNIYHGVLEDKEIKPVETGGTWYPDAPSERQGEKRKGVILHFHGGAFVTGDSRMNTLGFGAGLLTKHTNHYVFALQYRLASNPAPDGGRFPAALQDAVTAYQWLLDRGIPASDIILSGDSAGGNLVVALLRYIVENPAADLPKPKAALLWCAWVNPGRALHPHPCTSNRNYSTDFLEDVFAEWGVYSYAPPDSPIDAHTNPYVSPLKYPFKCEGVPMWAQFGDLEVLADDICHFTEGMREVGNEIALSETKGAPHDILLLGGELGFAHMADRMVGEAGAWLRERFSS
ncbi:MAG: hypothetical protein Q9218_007218 [Villophora microphyllina]